MVNIDHEILTMKTSNTETNSEKKKNRSTSKKIYPIQQNLNGLQLFLFQ